MRRSSTAQAAAMVSVVSRDLQDHVAQAEDEDRQAPLVQLVSLESLVQTVNAALQDLLDLTGEMVRRAMMAKTVPQAKTDQGWTRTVHGDAQARMRSKEDPTTSYSRSLHTRLDIGTTR